MRTSRGAIAASLLWALACTPPETHDATRTQAGLTNATPHDGDRAVLGLVDARAPSALRCTGTLIDERVVLTAAHCGVQDDASSFELAIGADVTMAERRIAALDAVAHPDYAGRADHDVALILLAEPAGIAPVSLLETLAIEPPFAVRLVGFGETAPTADDDGRKRQGAARVDMVLDHHVVMAGDPTLPCHGDSGGPVLVTTADGERLAAVISRGDAECAMRGRAARVDVELETFVRPWLARWAPGSIAPGARCLYDAHCERGTCVAALDDPRIRTCAEPCTTSNECVAPLACSADGLCRPPVPTPGALGSTCAIDDVCFDGTCVESEGVCSVRCIGEESCPTDYACTHLGGIDFFCLPSETSTSSGCAIAPSRTSWPAWLTLAIALLAFRRRRT